MDTLSASALRTDPHAILRALRAHHRPLLVIDHGRPAAVIQDHASYQATQDTIALLKLALRGERSIAAGRGSSTSEVMSRIRERVRTRDTSA